LPEVTLAEPGSLQEIYLARGEDVIVARPIMTGDVFTGVDLDLDNHDGTVMVVSHPCGMRGAEGQLRSRVVVAPVTPYQAIPFRRWPRGEYGVFPLPELRGEDDESRAVQLQDLNAVRCTRLDRANRMLSLKDLGIYVLVQRFVFSLSRVAVGLDKIQEQASGVLLEAELETDWVDDLADLDAPDSIEEQSREYARYMDSGVRRLLYDLATRSDTIRAVRSEIKSRRTAA
jgi:hypothetical protein